MQKLEIDDPGNNNKRIVLIHIYLYYDYDILLKRLVIVINISH